MELYTCLEWLFNFNPSGLVEFEFRFIIFTAYHKCWGYPILRAKDFEETDFAIAYVSRNYRSWALESLNSELG